MKISTVFLFVMILFFSSCKKSQDRRCFKSYGNIAELEVDIDSIQEFKLYGGIVYNFYQDTLRKLVIRGGENVISFIDVTQENYEVSINNLNSCDFLRDYDDKITVDIHYPHYTSIYAEPTEKMRFVDTLSGNQTKIELRNGGESLDLNVDVNRLFLNVSYGTGIINVYGRTGFLKLATQNLGRINALGIKADNMFIYQNSITDMSVNFDSTNVKIHFNGNGDIRFVGIPNLVEITGNGEGEVISY